MAAKLSGPSGGDRYTVSQNADINVTPFVDIMLVLLIIFMVSIPLATVSIKLDMPPSDPNQKVFDPKKAVFIRIHNDGRIEVKDKITSIEGLPADLRDAFRAAHPEVADPRDNAVPISAEPEVRYEQFMDVLNRLEDTGFLKIALVTEDIK
jgi:biopolymer transport protein ExbD